MVLYIMVIFQLVARCLKDAIAHHLLGHLRRHLRRHHLRPDLLRRPRLHQRRRLKQDKTIAPPPPPLLSKA